MVLVAELTYLTEGRVVRQNAGCIAPAYFGPNNAYAALPGSDGIWDGRRGNPCPNGRGAAKDRGILHLDFLSSSGSRATKISGCTVGLLEHGHAERLIGAAELRAPVVVSCRFAEPRPWWCSITRGLRWRFSRA